MATIKSYTDIEQSKVLAKILPLESADMFYIAGKGEPIFIGNKMVAYGDDDYDALGGPDVLCWSLSALISVLPYPTLSKDKLGGGKDGWMVSVYLNNCRYDSCWKDNSVDACMDIIERLHELKIL